MPPPGFKDRLFCQLQHLLPQHVVSRLVARLAEAETRWLKTLLVNQAVRRFNIDTSDAVHESPLDYSSFNAFFTRALKPGARPFAESPETIISPADGVISQCGAITEDRFFQAKGHTYPLISLVGDENLATQFESGKFVTVYLSPRDYHRVHMPLTGHLVEAQYIPGKLFSVNQATVAGVDNLFARNERLVCRFETRWGPVCVILVGALLVAGIESVWHGHYAPGKPCTEHFDKPLQYDKGSEIGRFKFGSTVILLLPESCFLEPGAEEGASVKVGESLARGVEDHPPSSDLQTGAA